jgi:hypothetical protein
MPSLHVGGALWALPAGWSVVRSRVGRILRVMYAPLTVLAVLVTGNHWMFAVIRSAAVLVAAVALTTAARRVAGRAARTTMEGGLPADAFDSGPRDVKPPVQAA